MELDPVLQERAGELALEPSWTRSRELAEPRRSVPEEEHKLAAAGCCVAEPQWRRRRTRLWVPTVVKAARPIRWWGLVGGALLAGALVFQVFSLDGWQGVVLAPLSESSVTVYAPGYSYFAFRRVRVGMTRAEVTKLIGAPLRQVPRPDGAVWVYSDSPVSRSYRMREVIFDRNGRVCDVVAEFVFD